MLLRVRSVISYLNYNPLCVQVRVCCRETRNVVATKKVLVNIPRIRRNSSWIATSTHNQILLIGVILP